MATERGNNIKLGVFVLVGTIVLVLALYLLGTKRDLFSRTIGIHAGFNEVSGLRVGNNVRYAGIDVGTVERITIVNDTQVMVDMMVRTDAAEHIRTNAIASIASDGLMGNRIVSLQPGDGQGLPVVDGTVLRTVKGLDIDAMLRTLGSSNENLVAITADLRELTHRMNTVNGPLALLGDTVLAHDVRSTLRGMVDAASNAREITARVNALVLDMQAGKGAVGALVSDPAAEQQVRDLLSTLGSVSDSLSRVSSDISQFAQGLNAPGGLGHTLTRDTAVVADVERVIAHLDTSAATLSEDLRALQRNWFFRKYFKEKKNAREHQR